MKPGDLVKWWTGDVPHVGEVESTTADSAFVLMGPGPKRIRKVIAIRDLTVLTKKDGRGNPK